MSGILYTTADRQFDPNLKRIFDKSLVNTDLAKILVYQSRSGRTGLSVDVAGEALTYSLLTNSYICSPSGQVTSFVNSHRSFEEDILSFLAKGGPNPVAFVAPDERLHKALNDYRAYFSALKRNELKARYGKVVEQPDIPVLSNLFTSDLKEYYAAVEMLLRSCRRVMVWPSYGGGFGMHTICITQDHASYRTEILEPWADKYSCEVHELPEYCLLPTW